MSLHLGLGWSGDLLEAFGWLSGRGQPVGAKRERFLSLSTYPRMPLSWSCPPAYTWAKHPHGGPTWTRTREN
ncbi:hypothetical protein DFAR_850008 [Desulfarculales bacterium]